MKLQCLLVDDEPPALEVRKVAYLELVATCGNAWKLSACCSCARALVVSRLFRPPMEEVRPGRRS